MPKKKPLTNQEKAFKALIICFVTAISVVAICAMVSSIQQRYDENNANNGTPIY